MTDYLKKSQVEPTMEQSRFYTIKISSWQEAFAIAIELEKFFFRGQAQSRWSLATSLERTVEQNRQILEKDLLYNFKRMAHHYISNLPQENENLEWLALLQHYGGKTRLLDFTYSFYLAAYFATENLDETIESAVWAINGTKIRNSILKKLPMKNQEFLRNEIESSSIRIREIENEVHREMFEGFFQTPTTESFVCYTEPRRLNERIAVQQGLFLCPSQVNCSFENCLISSLEGDRKQVIEKQLETVDLNTINKTPKNDIGLVKIIIPKKEKTLIQTELIKMNINAASLFPGLDGYVKALWHSRYLDNRHRNSKEEQQAKRDIERADDVLLPHTLSIRLNELITKLGDKA